MGLVRALNGPLARMVPTYLALARCGAIRPSKKRSWEIAPEAPLDIVEKLPDFFQGISEDDDDIETHLGPAYILGWTLAEGPKLFALDALTCEALENFDLSLRGEDYLQPFPSVVIDLPQDYATRRVVPAPTVIGDTRPDFVIVRHEGPHLWVYLYLQPGASYTLSFRLDEDDWFARPFMDGYDHGFLLTVTKLAMNACLMASTYGVRTLGPDNPAYHARLERLVRTARKRGDPARILRAEEDLSAHPMCYAFSQDVTLYRTEQVAGRDGGDDTGRTTRPHWRRGHWRMQRFGPALSERRRVAIPAVLVNAHLFGGTTADTTATYHMRSH